MWLEFECEEVFSEQRPIPDNATWMLLRGAYVATVGRQFSSIGYGTIGADGVLVRVKVDYVPGKGRGVFALEDMPEEGTHVWDALYTARFPSAIEYRRFLASIPEDLACDVLIWSYVERSNYKDPSSSRVSLDLDACSFMNNIMDNLEDQNLANNYRMTRHIWAGEELIVNYEEFVEEGGWEHFGLADYQ